MCYSLHVAVNVCINCSFVHLYYIIMLALFVKVSTIYRPQLFVYERSAILSRSRNILRIAVLLRASAHVNAGEVMEVIQK